MMASAQASEAVGHEANQISREQFAWAKELGQKQFDLASGVVKQQGDIATQNQAQAQDQWKRYKNIFAPVEERMVSDANNYDSPEQQDRVRQAAAGNANQAYDTALASRNAGLTRMGVNPNSGRFGSTDPNDPVNSGNRAAAVAGSMNDATSQLRDKAIGLRAGAASFGRNMPNTAAQAYGLATNAGNSQVGNMNSTASSMVQNTGSPMQWRGAGLQGYSTAGGIYGNEFSGRISAYNAQTQANASMWGGIGHGVGAYFGAKRGGVIKGYGLRRVGYKAGGIVKGPGDGSKDTVPAKLANGEGVLNAGAVEMLGEEFVHAMNRAGLERNASMYEGVVVPDEAMNDQTGDTHDDLGAAAYDDGATTVGLVRMEARRAA
jgi:hypothetical protein